YTDPSSPSTSVGFLFPVPPPRTTKKGQPASRTSLGRGSSRVKRTRRKSIFQSVPSTRPEESGALLGGFLGPRPSGREASGVKISPQVEKKIFRSLFCKAARASLSHPRARRASVSISTPDFEVSRSSLRPSWQPPRS